MNRSKLKKFFFVITIITIVYILYPKIKDPLKVKNKDSFAETKKAVPRKLKSLISSYTINTDKEVQLYSPKKYQSLKKIDEKRVNDCSIQLRKHFKRSEKTGNIKVLNFDLLQKSLVVECSFKLFSQEYMDKVQGSHDLDYKAIDGAELYRPYTLFLDIFRAFFKNKNELRKHHNNIHNFIKTNVEIAPPSRVGAFYIWMGVLDEYSQACGVQTMTESDDFFTDLDRENNHLFDISALKKDNNNLKKLNENLRLRRDMIKRLQLRLKNYFYKYENDLKNCFRA